MTDPTTTDASATPAAPPDEPTTGSPTEPTTEREVATVGAREGLGAGIIGLGILAVAMPAVVDQLPSVVDGGSAAFVLYGMSVMIGIFVIIAGVMTFFVKD